MHNILFHPMRLRKSQVLRSKIQQNFNNFADKFSSPPPCGVEEPAHQPPLPYVVEGPIKQAPPPHGVEELDIIR